MLSKTLVVLACSTFALSTFAQPIPTCKKVTNLKEAQACMDKVAATFPAGNDDAGGFATSNQNFVKKVLMATGRGALVSKVKPGEFIGAVVQRWDEYSVFYFTIKKGTNVKPVEFASLNTVDLDSELTTANIKTSDFLFGQDADETLSEIIAEEFVEYKDNQ